MSDLETRLAQLMEEQRNIRLDDPMFQWKQMKVASDIQCETIRYFRESRERRNRADFRFMAVGILCILLFFCSLLPFAAAFAVGWPAAITGGVLIFMSIACGAYALHVDSHRLEQ